MTLLRHKRNTFVHININWNQFLTSSCETVTMIQDVKTWWIVFLAKSNSSRVIKCLNQHFYYVGLHLHLATRGRITFFTSFQGAITPRFSDWIYCLYFFSFESFFLLQRVCWRVSPSRCQHQAVREGIPNKCIGEESRGCRLSQTSFFFYLISFYFVRHMLSWDRGHGEAVGGVSEGALGSDRETT